MSATYSNETLLALFDKIKKGQQNCCDECLAEHSPVKSYLLQNPTNMVYNSCMSCSTRLGSESNPLILAETHELPNELIFFVSSFFTHENGKNKFIFLSQDELNTWLKTDYEIKTKSSCACIKQPLDIKYIDSNYEQIKKIPSYDRHKHIQNWVCNGPNVLTLLQSLKINFWIPKDPQTFYKNWNIKMNTGQLNLRRQIQNLETEFQQQSERQDQCREMMWKHK